MVSKDTIRGADAMGQRFTEEQLEQMIMQLEQSPDWRKKIRRISGFLLKRNGFFIN